MKKSLVIKIFKTVLIGLLIGVVGYIGVIGFIFTKGEKEVTEITNPNNGEKIYLIKHYVYDHSKIVIGLNKRLPRFRNDSKTQYSNRYAEGIFYKFDSQGLVIYHHYSGDFIEPVKNRFKTKIRFIKLNNPDFINLGLNKQYATKNLIVFPDSELRRLNYVDNMNKNKQ